MMLGCASCSTACTRSARARRRGSRCSRAWRARLLASSTVVLLFTLYFVIRFGWVGRKIAAGRIGPMPRPPLPMPVLGIAPIGGFVTALARPAR